MSNISVPVGLIILQSGNVYPGNFLLCDGSSLKQIDYPDLFNIIGTMYGPGDGSDTFNLPNLQDNVSLGSSSNNPIVTESSNPSIKIDADNVPLLSMNQPSGGNIPIVFNSPTGIINWEYLKGLMRGDDSKPLWFPFNNTSNSNGTNLMNYQYGTPGPTNISIPPPKGLNLNYIICSSSEPISQHDFYLDYSQAEEPFSMIVDSVDNEC